MDLTMVDVTAVPDVRIGDEVVVVGRQGAAEISADEAAAWIGTINYEVVTALTDRVPRIYSGP
jgi:alanine racemase